MKGPINFVFSLGFFLKNLFGDSVSSMENDVQLTGSVIETKSGDLAIEFQYSQSEKNY